MFHLINIVESGFPKLRDYLPTALQDYHQFREHLWTIDSVILYKNRIMIPPSLRTDILVALHAAHQGISTMTACAEDSVFWPGITRCIISMRETCKDCNRNAPSQPSAPPTPLTLPVYPFQCICADFFKYHGTNYLVAVDRYSNWPILERSQDGANGLITILRRMFATYVTPD